MPRGVPNAGFRVTQKSLLNGGLPYIAPQAPLHVPAFEVPVVIETDEEISARITERFEILNYLTDMTITGDSRALLVSGPPGLGKSFDVERKLSEWDSSGENYNIEKGFTRATGIYKMLYARREKNQVLVLDDLDDAWKDLTCLNLLKAACDTTENRILSWGAETKMVDGVGEIMPNKFLFEGAVIFLTNINFDEQIARGSVMAPHYEAMISRANYVNMGMTNRRDYLVRIKQVVDMGMLMKINPSCQAQQDVVGFLEENLDKLREVSLRCAIKLAQHRKNTPQWERIAKATMFR